MNIFQLRDKVVINQHILLLLSVGSAEGVAMSVLIGAVDRMSSFIAVSES